MLKIFIFSLVLIKVAFNMDFQQRCSQFNNSFSHGSSCFIGRTNKKTQAAAMASCNDMGKGHLAFISSQQTLDKLLDLADTISTHAAKAVWIGLVQKDPAPADEPDGKWSWIHPDGRFWMPNNRWIIPWDTNEPDNVNNGWEGALVGGGGFRKIHDAASDGTEQFEYICEYEDSQKLYKENAINTVGNNMTKIQETVESHIGKCAIQCSIELPCRAFSYNGNNGSCILHYLPSDGFAGFEPEDQQGYIMFDTYY